MQGFDPTLLEKLFDDDPKAPVSPVLRRLNIEELKRAVARDVELLLNTRAVLSEEDLAAYPECKQSIASYGLIDFAGRSMASFEDRSFVCRSIELAIARHEARLKSVRVTLDPHARGTNALSFSISALLVVNPAREAVSFDAVLQPSSCRYSVLPSQRANR